MNNKLREYKMYYMEVTDSLYGSGELYSLNNDYNLERLFNEGWRIVSCNVVQRDITYPNPTLLLVLGRSEIEEDLYG